MSINYTPNDKSNGVYLMRFMGSELVYIGSTARGFGNRRSEHIYQLRTNRHTNRHLQYAYNYYGLAQFEFTILEVVNDPSQVLRREDYWMDTYRETHQLYNVLPHAGSSRGHKMPMSMVEKQRARMIGNTHNSNGVRKVYEGLVSPDGVEYRNITNLTDFCKEHGLREKHLASVTTGRTMSYHGWTLIGADVSKMRPKQRFSFIAPDGTQYDDIPNLTTFCRDHGLSKGAMSAVHRGRHTQHNGWTVHIDAREQLIATYYSFRDPDGVVYENITSLAEFSRQHNLNASAMSMVWLKKPGHTHHNGWRRVDTDYSRVYAFIAPDGTRHDGILCLADFCDKHGLSRGMMSHIHTGVSQQYKGWTKGD